ncbi:MAG TPA: hypothetical protein VIP05_16755 [Burkholderiaceae bacterium]
MTAASTTWTCSVDTSASPPRATLAVSVDGGAPTPFAIRGACYSPCPVNGANSYGPNLGDWFWDSYSGPGYSITGWDELWQRDLPNLVAMGVNTVRVYNMMSRQLNPDGSYPQPWNGGHLFTHANFLDACQAAGVQVLVGIGLPQTMFWSAPPGPVAAPGEIEFWTNVLSETAAQVGAHPAVLGFVFMNEWDAGLVTYPQPPGDPTNLDAVDYWWSQVEALAAAVKGAAPTKLVGIAVHDDPNICGGAASWMAECPDVDFWGVNSYQTSSFASVFGATPSGPGYDGVAGAALKPVLLTEWGMPATTRTTPSDPSTICQTPQSIAKAAGVVAEMLPQAYGESLCIGLCYFEYSDEWWNQGGAPNLYTWWGGSQAAGFPNGYWDQDGFGLYQTIPGAGAGGGAIWSNANNAPATPLDKMVARAATIAALKAVFGG